MEREPILQVDGLEVRYGGVTALWGVSLAVEAGAIVAILGANGAGKSTLLNAISGIVRPAAGNIRFDGADIAGKSTEAIVKGGIGQVPEGRRVFGNLTVTENLQVGAYLERDTGVVRERMERVFTLFPKLHERQRQMAATLSGGEQQMLAIGRALMLQPKLLMLDEPSLGLAPIIVSDVFRNISSIREGGTTILLVEQNSRMALRYADSGYVLETGRIVLSGSRDRLLHDADIGKAYLGQALEGR